MKDSIDFGREDVRSLFHKLLYPTLGGMLTYRNIMPVVTMVYICLCQSLERTVQATAVTVLRGFVLTLACFLILPAVSGLPGAWLAVPVTELLTASTVAACHSHESPRRAFFSNLCPAAESTLGNF